IVNLCSICLHSTETKPDRSLPRSSRPCLCRERLDHYRGESILYISDSTSFHYTLNHNQAHCVLEKNDLGYLMPVKTTKNELISMHKRKKMKAGVELGGIVSTLTRTNDINAEAQQALPKKCRDPKIFSVISTIGDCTFVDAMLDLGASINVMPTSIYKSLNFGDLEPPKMTIQLANRSVVHPLGVLEDVLVQVNELIFPTNFYMLDMEEETLGKGSTLIMGRPFLMIARTKIDVHVGRS
ncbi:hypothetical protein CR513_27963, partial [Mucuna pruriens]